MSLHLGGLIMVLTKLDQTVATAQIADACLRLNIPLRFTPPGLKPVVHREGMLWGPAVPVRHYGSVDVFFEALESAPPNGILVIDNNNRQDEACVGDLVALEVKHAG